MHFKKYKTILSPKNGMNIYRGCSHGCIYCDSRSACYQMDHAFEDIEVKENAPEILKEELKKKRKPVMIGTGSMSDPYNHVETNIRYTRKCLELIFEHNCGVAIQTKSSRILEDIDLIDKINKNAKAVVAITLTTYDDDLCKIIEPNVSVTSQRVKVLEECYKRNIKTIVWLDPFLPYINDTEENLKNLLSLCVKNHVYGIIFFGFGLTLREGNREYFYKKLDEHFPKMKERYIQEFGNNYEVISKNSEKLYKILVSTCKENNIILNNDKIFSFLRFLPERQMTLFEFDN